MAHLGRAADAPAHKDPYKDPADFSHTNKAMRCCYVCRLVKTERQVGAWLLHLALLEQHALWLVKGHRQIFAPIVWRSRVEDFVQAELQFFEMGCDNCQFLGIAEDRSKVQDYTTPNFSGCAGESRVLTEHCSGCQVTAQDVLPCQRFIFSPKGEQDLQWAIMSC
jgi:hypothetical protein